MKKQKERAGAVQAEQRRLREEAKRKQGEAEREKHLRAERMAAYDQG
jgi:hypothetical protein